MEPTKQDEIVHCNVTEMLRVKQRILAEGDGKLWMQNWVHPECGTVRCIAGWAVPEETLSEFIPMLARERLGLTPRQAFLLFHVRDDSDSLAHYMRSDITAAQAAQAIDNVIAYGTPKWKEILEGTE